MTLEPEKSMEQIRAKFEAAQTKVPKVNSTPLSEAAIKFLRIALAGNHQAPGKGVRTGKVQDGEFD